jgi:hypothetical protein
MNPEFRRNLLLELTPHRLVVMPLILLLLYGAAGLVEGGEAASSVAGFVMLILLVAWGTRLAADAVLGEVAGRTWDSQRMSALEPWPMGWAKLLGSTIFVWYGGILSIPALLYGRADDVLDLLRIITVGLFAQALALFVSLVIQRLRPERLRFQVTQAQLAGLVGAILLWNALHWHYPEIDWYGFTFWGAEFTLVSGLIFLAWCCLGVYRLMRAELQFRCWPAGWAAFTVFCAIYVAGFAPRRLVDVVVFSPNEAMILRLLLAYFAVTALTWLAAFAEPKGFVRLRRWRDTARAGSLRRILGVLPSWLPGLLLAIAACILLVVLSQFSEGEYFLSGRMHGPTTSGPISAFAVALLLFLLRDIGILHLVTMDGRTRHTLMSALVYFGVLYAILPAILFSLDLGKVVPVLLPSPSGQPAVVILPVLLQVILTVGLIGYRWRRLARAMEAAGVSRP